MHLRMTPNTKTSALRLLGISLLVILALYVGVYVAARSCGVLLLMDSNPRAPYTPSPYIVPNCYLSLVTPSWDEIGVERWREESRKLALRRCISEAIWPLYSWVAETEGSLRRRGERRVQIEIKSPSRQEFEEAFEKKYRSEENEGEKGNVEKGLFSD